MKERLSSRRRIGLIIVELICVALLVVYDLRIVVNHSLTSQIIYCAFSLVLLGVIASLWYLFIIRRPRIGVRQATPRLLLMVCIIAILLAVLMEMITIGGAPLARLDDPTSWHVSRMLVFLVIDIFLVCLCVFFDWHGRSHRLADRFRKIGVARVMTVAWIYVIVIIASAALAIIYCLVRRDTYLGPYLLTGIVCGVMLCTLILIRRSLGAHPERGFIVVFLSMGLLLAVLAPSYSFVGWDDGIHYIRATTLSYIVDPEYTTSDWMIGTNQIEDTWWCNDFHNVDDAPYGQGRLAEIHDVLNWNNGSDGAFQSEGAATFYDVSLIAYYTPSYIPSAIGVWTGRALHLPWVAHFILGRLCNLLFSAIVLYQAIKRLRSGKMILVVLTLIPTFVFLCSSYSYDYWVVVLTMYGFAYFVSELQRPDKPLEGRDLALMLGSLSLGILPKPVYFPILLILLLMPKSKFSGRLRARTYRLWIISLMLIIIATFCLPFLSQGAGSGDDRGGSTVNSTDQIAFMLYDPIRYVKLLLKFMGWYVLPAQAWGYTVNMAFLGVAQGSIPLLCLIVLVAFTDRGPLDRHYALWRNRIWTFLFLFVCLALVATSLYISFTPVGYYTVKGCQLRYIFPLLLPFWLICCDFPSLGTRRFKLGSLSERVGHSLYNFMVLLLSTGFLFYTCWTVLLGRFW